MNLLGLNFAGFIMFKPYQVHGFDNWIELSESNFFELTLKEIGDFQKVCLNIIGKLHSNC